MKHTKAVPRSSPEAFMMTIGSPQDNNSSKALPMAAECFSNSRPAAPRNTAACIGIGAGMYVRRVSKWADGFCLGSLGVISSLSEKYG
jgi:hypothetical protein